jgi:hypothetical protein
MQQWSKDFIEKTISLPNSTLSVLRYAQQSFNLFATGHYFMHPLAFELCRQKILSQGSTPESGPITIQDVMTNDHSWVKRIPDSGGWHIFSSTVKILNRASLEDRLFQMYGGY